MKKALIFAVKIGAIISFINYYENLKLNWPISWVVQPLKNVLLPMESCKPNGESFEYIDIESIDNKSNCIASSKTIKSSDAPSRATRKLSDGDVLFSIVRPYLKNIAIVSKSFAKCIGSTGFYVCKPIKLLKTQSLYYFLLSPYCIDGIMPFMKGDNSPSIRGTDLERLYIGFPAFNEQEKIVKKIIYLFEKIDNQSY